jgi:pimeloyl-ACP methyl ester carboxylesterase
MNTELDPTTEYKSLKYIPLPNGETYAYRKCGDKENVLVLVHGNLTSAISFMALIPSLTSEYTVYAPDMRGYGNSTYNKIINSHSDYADDLKLFLDALKITKCALLGWSTGGASIFTFGVKYADYVEKLVLFFSIGPKGYPIADATEPITKKEDNYAKSKMTTGMKERLETKNKESMRQIWIWLMGPLPEDLMESKVEESFMQRNLEEIIWINLIFNVSNENNGITEGDGTAATLTKKILVIAGENDSVCPLPVEEEWKKFVGDNATLKVMPGYGHGPTIAKCPEIGGVILDFLKN